MIVLEVVGGLNIFDGDVDEFVLKKLLFEYWGWFEIVIDEEIYKEIWVVYGGVYSFYYCFIVVVIEKVVDFFGS